MTDPARPRRAGRRVQAALLAMALLPLLAFLGAPAAAHGPPKPGPGEVRLLVDHNDDCGEANTQCQGTHDLIALYVREAADAELGDLVVFRFFANGGNLSGPLRDVFTFEAAGRNRTLELTTADNRAFEAWGDVPAARVGRGASLEDPAAPERYSVEVAVRRADLGNVGDALAGFRIEAYRGSVLGDYLPGGYVGAGGDVPDPEQGSQPTNAAVASYRLRGPAAASSSGGPSTTGGDGDAGRGAAALPAVPVAAALLATAVALARRRA